MLLSELKVQLHNPEPYGDPSPKELKDVTTRYKRSTDEFTHEYRKEKLGVFLMHRAFIARPPTGTVVNNRVRTARLPIVLNGAELASMFEAEKTAVWHQHVLLTLMDMPGMLKGSSKPFRLREVISPVRQALMQAALHLTTLSALCAIWRFKWRDYPDVDPVERRQRPSEYFKDPNNPLEVLFDSEIRFNDNGDILRDLSVRKKLPECYPGSPRHPSYGSGHSTYSKAASEVLKVFLPRRWGMDVTKPTVKDPQDYEGGDTIFDIHGELDKLANSIGEARIWGGVHWPSDHVFGQRVGRAVANCVIKQLNDSLVDPNPPGLICPPTRDDIKNEFARITNSTKPRWDWATNGPYPPDPTTPAGTKFNVQGQAG